MPDFHNQSTRVLQNEHLRLEYLTQAGPRLLRLFLQGGQENLFGEFPDVGWDTPRGYYELLGGHRLWAAPETPGVSYLPDSSGLVVHASGPGVELVFDPGPGQGLGMSVQVSLSTDRPAVTIVHTIINRFEHPVRIAPWGITVFPLGGRAYLPSPPAGGDFQPDRALALWPYVRWDDPRLKFSSGGIMVEAKAGMPPIKVGTFVASGCCAYLREGILFVKRFETTPGEYPDRGCNAEVYCSDRLIEIESLAPLSDVTPGGSISATETWEIYARERATQKLNDIFSNGDPS
jgi:hypothetical protein